MAEKKKTQEPAEKASGSKLKWIILILILLVLLGAGGGAAYYFLVYSSSEQPEATDEPAQPAAAAAAPAPNAPPIYHPLDVFTVNIAAPGPVRFLRVKMTVVTRDPGVASAIDKNMPMIRNDLLSLLGSQEFEKINTQEGKDTLREQIKQAISRILVKAGGPSSVDEVLFTDFVMQ